MMRVGLDGRFLDDHYPGIGRYVFNLGCALPAVAGTAELFVLVNQRRQSDRFPLAALEERGLTLIDVGAAPRSLAEQLRLPWTVSRLRLDLLHLPFWWRPWRLPCPTVLTLYDVIPLQHPRSLPSAWRRRIYRLAVRRAARAARCVLTLSAAARRDLLEHLPLDPSRIAVTPAAADPRLGPATAERITAIRERYRLARPYLLCLGSDRPHKNLEVLFAAWSRLRGELSRYELLTCGTGERPPAEERDGARRLGAVPEEDLAPLLSGAELLVLPSLVEGFGLPLLEAMACGTAVACSRIASLVEAGGEAALYFDPGDSADIAATLRRALTDESLRRRMEAAALHQAGTFSWRETARQTWDVYLRAVGR